jgi:hypothetical protein
MLDSRPCNVSSAEELDAQIRDIFALDMVGRGDEISGTLHVYYTDDSVRNAAQVPTLENRGVFVEWHRQ